MCGRAGYEFTDYKDDNGKRQIEKTGTKMKTEGETGFEPSLLVFMEQIEDLRTNIVRHQATVQKDRSALLDGAKIINPGFADFLPHIEMLKLGGNHIGVDTSSDSQHILKTEKRDWQPVQRDIVIDEIKDLLVLHHSSTGAADKKAKIELLKAHFKASWVEIEEVMPLERLRAGYDSLHMKLQGEPSKYGVREPERIAINDELPGDLAPPKPTNDGLELPGFLDRRAKPNGAQATEPNWTELYTAG